MKPIEQLEQEAKQAREVAAMALSEVLPYGSGPGIADKLILAAVAMVTYQLALGMKDADQIWNESGTKVISEKLPEVLQAQKEGNSDGWIDWGGGDCPVGYHEYVSVKNRDGSICKGWQAGDLRWEYAGKNAMLNPAYDIIAYRIVK